MAWIQNSLRCGECVAWRSERVWEWCDINLAAQNPSPQAAIKLKGSHMIQLFQKVLRVSGAVVVPDLIEAFAPSKIGHSFLIT